MRSTTVPSGGGLSGRDLVNVPGAHWCWCVNGIQECVGYGYGLGVSETKTCPMVADVRDNVLSTEGIEAPHLVAVGRGVDAPVAREIAAGWLGVTWPSAVLQ